ncbi:MAG: LysE family transporter [Campylobacterota bacterium]|nr:LysE family transporter [Campylobacterota bacterium]
MFISLFIEGFVLGLGAALPLGPINLLIMNEALRSYKKAVAIGFGAMSVDVTYLVLIQYGITNYMQEDFFLRMLSLLGGVFLTYLAFLIFKGRNKHIKKRKPSKESTLLSNYVKGYLLTFLNPYTILFWLSITTYSTTTDSLVITLFGLMSAIMLWITIMPYVVYKKRALVSDGLASIIAIVSSVIILLFGLSLFVKSFTQ